MVKKVLIIFLICSLIFVSISHALEIGGGWQTEKTYSPQIDFLRRAENIVYNLQGAIKKRPPLAHHATVVAHVSTAHGPIYGMFDFWKSGIVDSPTEQFLVRIGNDISYNNTGTDVPIHTPTITSSNIPMDFAVMGDKCIIGFDGNVLPLQYSQTVGSMPDIPDIGNSWMFEEYHSHIFAAGDPAYPSRVYISVPLVHRDAIDFIGTGSTTVDVDPDDGDQIIGIKSFLNGLYIFKGPNRLSIHKITGTSLDDFVKSVVVRGVGGYNNTIIQFGNDLAFIDPNGIHTLSASIDFGGIRESFLSAPIQTYWDTLQHNYLDKACAVHVPELHSILFAVPATGGQNSDIIGYDYLVPNSNGSVGRWFKWPNLDVASMCNRIKDGKMRTYFGTYGGNIALLDSLSTTYGDYGLNSYTGLILTPYMYGSAIDIEKQVESLGLVIYPTIDSDITGTLMIEGEGDQIFAFDQSGIGGRLGTFVLGVDRLGGEGVKIVYPTTGRAEGSGRHISLRLENAVLNANMEIHYILIYTTDIGIKYD